MARYLIVAMLALSAGATASAQDEHFPRLIEWLSGRWDNHQQAMDDTQSGAPVFDRHAHHTLNYVPVDAPRIAGQLFALQSFDDGGFSGPMTRVSLHRFVPSKVSTEIVHDFLFLDDPSAWGDLKASLTSLGSLRESDLRSNRRCRMYWRWVSDHFEGRTRKGRCVTSSYAATEVLVERFGALYADRLVRHDLDYEPGGELRQRQGGRTAEIFDKK